MQDTREHTDDDEVYPLPIPSKKDPYSALGKYSETLNDRELF
jgi:hypothetical protein